jgi:hypothetical protein
MKSIQKSLSLIAVYAVLAATMPITQLHAQVNCNAFNGGCGGAYEQQLGSYAISAGVKAANLQFNGVTPSATYLKNMVSTLNTYLAKANSSGTLTVAQNIFVANASAIEAANPNVTNLYNSMVADGYLGTLADVQNFSNSTTQAQRTSLVNGIQAMGLYKYLLSYTAAWQSYSTEIGSLRRQGRGRLLNASFNPQPQLRMVAITAEACNQWMGINLGAGVIGAELALFGIDPFGDAIMAVAAGSAFIQWYYCS